MNEYELDDELIGQVSELSFKYEGGLSFPAPMFWAANGSAKEKAPSPLFYGGWSVSRQNMDDAVSKERRVLPDGMQAAETVSREGKNLALYVTRSLVVAPVAYRRSWLTKDRRRLPSYEAGSRQHAQILCVLGMKLKTPSESGAIYTPWGPVVLSAKGFQAKNLLGALTSWEDHISALRAAVAKKVPAWLFWCSIGTHGKERLQEMVGQGQNQSPITPIGAYLPDVTEDLLKKLYGGEPLARQIVDLRAKSTDWAKAWETASEPSYDEGGGGNAARADAEDIPF